MLCEVCKIREANIKYTEVMNGVKTEHNLCAQCAKEMDFGPYSAIFDGDFPLGKLLSGLLGIEEDEEKKENLQQIICPTCGTSYDEFVKNSRFGCADCYSVFDLLITESIKQLQGSDCHTGKKPEYESKKSASEFTRDQDNSSAVSMEEALGAWEARLKEALRIEDYELAARCRDQIKELKEGKETNA